MIAYIYITGILHNHRSEHFFPGTFHTNFQNLFIKFRIIFKEISQDFTDRLCILFASWLILHRLNFTLFYSEQSIIMIHCLQDFIQVFPVGIGNKYLPETISTDQLDDLSHSFRIQFIKYIIQKQNGSCLPFPGQKKQTEPTSVLSDKFYFCPCEPALRINCSFNVISSSSFGNTVGSISQNTVTLPLLAASDSARFRSASWDIYPQSDLFGRTADRLIIFVKNRIKLSTSSWRFSNTIRPYISNCISSTSYRDVSVF